MFLAPTLSEVLIAAALFVAASYLRAFTWDPLGFGFKIRFRLYHLYLLPPLAVRDVLRGRRRASELNWAAVAAACLILAAVLASCYLAACGIVAVASLLR